MAKFEHAIANVVDIAVTKRRIHGQHEYPLKQSVRKWQWTLEAQISELVYGLPAPRDKCSNPALCEMFTQRIPAVRLDFVVLENVEVGRRLIWRGGQHQARRIVQTGLIKRREMSSTLDCFVVPIELVTKERGLKIIESRIQPPSPHFAKFVAAMIAEQFHLLKYLLVVRDYTAAIAQAAKRLCRVEADASCAAKGSCTAPPCPVR